MPSFGAKSQGNLVGVHPDLIELANEVVKHFDCSVLCGHRNATEQDRLFRAGKTKLKYPASKHNKNPAEAIDLVPYPIDWQDFDRFHFFAGFVKATAIQLGISIRAGADWDGDNTTSDEKFLDFPHFELIGDDDDRED